MSDFCVYIEECTLKIDRRWYGNYCSSNWNKCPEYRERVEPNRTAKEWALTDNEEQSSRATFNRIRGQ